MDDFSILIGGKAGFGIDRSSLVIAGIINRLGYRIYVYRDYPSLIRGGHTFSIIRASREKVSAHKDKIDILLALNQDTVDIHKDRLKVNATVIYDSDAVKTEAIPSGRKLMGLPLTAIIKEEGASEIMRNTSIIGALSKALSIDWGIVEAIFRKSFTKEADLNLKVARRGYDGMSEQAKLESLNRERMSLLTGNETTALGLIKGGLKVYIAYPMTPSSPVLHYLAGLAEEFSLKVIHPESEISVILMALGFSYCGQKTAVGTSGGGVLSDDGRIKFFRHGGAARSHHHGTEAGPFDGASDIQFPGGPPFCA